MEDKTEYIKNDNFKYNELIIPKSGEIKYGKYKDEYLKIHIRAGIPWKKNEDDLLKKLYVEEKKEIYEICKIHQRAPGGIISRLKKLNLISQDESKKLSKKSDTKKEIKSEVQINPMEEYINEIKEIRKEISEIRKILEETFYLKKKL